MAFTNRQKKALSIIPRVAGVMSLFGSGSILYDILTDRKKLGLTYYRLLFVFSVFDCINSIWLGLSTWPIPKDSEDVFDARGNTATCTAQGFFIQLSLISPMYNSMLAVYYLLLVRYGLSETRIARKWEPFMHAYPLLIAFGTALSGLWLTLYNNANIWCWIAPYPMDCQGSRGQAGTTDCERGYNAWIFRWAFYYGPLWFTIVDVTAIMVVLWASVRRDEARAIEVHDLGQSSPDDERQAGKARRTFYRSKRMFSQSVWYAGAFYITWTGATVNRLVQLFTGNSIFSLMVLHAFFVPAQGFFNCLVYRRGPCIG